jgi:hypothetical protein
MKPNTPTLARTAGLISSSVGLIRHRYLPINFGT